MRALIFIVFLLAVLAIGVLGTETRLLFFWPGCALLGVAGLLAGFRWKLRIRFTPSDVCIASALLLAACLVARALASPVEYLAREDVFLILGCLTAYLLTATVASHPRWRLIVMGVLLALVVGNLGLGFVHFSGKWDFHVAPHFARSFDPGRIGGFFNNPNHLAAFFSLVLLASAGLLCFGRGSATWKLLLGFFIVAMAIGMALTVSRGAMIGLVGGGLVFAAAGIWMLWKTHRHLLVRIVIGVGVLVVLGGGILFKVTEEYVRHRMTTNPAGRDPRLFVWKAAWAQHAESPTPLIGDGARLFYDTCFTYRPADTPSWVGDAMFAHNEYLQLLVDYGWIGLALAGMVVATHAGNGIQFLRWFATARFPRDGMLSSNGLGLAIGSLAALAATLIHAVFEFHGHVAATAITASILLGMLANPGFDGPEHRPLRLPGARFAAKIGLIAASLAMIAGAFRYGRADYQVALAQIAQKSGNRLACKQHLTHGLEADPANPQAWYLRGLEWLDSFASSRSANVQARTLQGARDDLARAVELDPYNYLYRLALADACDGLRQHDEARRHIDRALALAPNYEEPRLALAMHLHRQMKFAEAEVAYLWASRAPAMNLDGSTRWNQGYALLLKHASNPVRAAPAEDVSATGP